MTQRERILAILVGALLIFGGIHWLYGKYRTAVTMRETQIESLEEKQMMLTEKQMQGARADRQMGEYRVRSLPGDKDRARSIYTNWLWDIVRSNKLRGAKVDPLPSVPMGKLYTRHGFTIAGSSDFQGILNLMHSFYAKEYLHRVRVLSIKPDRKDKNVFDLNMTVDAIGLNSVPIDSPEPGNESWRVDSDVVAYTEPILNRNLFQPPNQAPRLDGRSQLQAIVGKESPISLTFKDAEGHRLQYELLSAPEDMVTLDSRSGTMRVKSDEKKPIEVLVRVTDNGYPRMSVEQKLTVNVVDPPPPPKQEPPPPKKPKFDDASQTFLTGLVKGRDDWVAWMDVRTRGKTLKLRVGDEFEIGSVKGKITAIDAKFVQIEIEGNRITLDQNGSLGDAAKKAEED